MHLADITMSFVHLPTRFKITCDDLDGKPIEDTFANPPLAKEEVEEDEEEGEG